MRVARLRIVALGIAALGGSLLCSARAQQPQASQPKTFTFEMRGKPWAAVFEWLTDKTGVPLVSPNVPPGTFNFIARQGQQFTIPQVIDIINDGLALQKYVLINRRTSFAILAEQEVLPSWVPRISLHELREHGKTEIVSTIVKLKMLAADETAGDVRKQLSPFGSVVPLKQMNALIVQDTVGNLENILAVLRDGENAVTGPNPGTTQVFELNRGNAAAAAELIRQMLPPGAVQINPPGTRVPVKE